MTIPQRFPGGRFPRLGPLLNETLSAFTADLAPYAIAGLGQLLVVLPLAFLFTGAVLVGGFGMAIGAQALEQSDAQAAAPLVVLVGLAVIVVGGLGSLSVLVAPVTGSLYRAVLRHQRGEATLDFKAAFSSWGQHLMSSIVVMLVILTGALFGVMLCYLPVFLVALLSTWAFPLAALHGVRPLTALRRSASLSFKFFGWHLGHLGYTVLIQMIASYVPIVGPMFIIAYHVRVYREVFGDGELPAEDITVA